MPVRRETVLLAAGFKYNGAAGVAAWPAFEFDDVFDYGSHMRIIAGQYKGRNLLAPPNGTITRPITGAVKKSLFGMLGEDLTNWTVLDLYCGTGTLGIEALSRGARWVCFAENDPRVINCLRRNLSELSATDRGTIWCGDVTAKLQGWVSQLKETVDLAMVDPPYAQTAQWDWADIGLRLFVPLAEHLADSGIVTLRLPADVPLPQEIGPLKVNRVRKYGSMALALLGK